MFVLIVWKYRESKSKNSPKAPMGDILIKMVIGGHLEKFQFIYFHQIIVKSCVIYHLCMAIYTLLYAVVWRLLLFSKSIEHKPSIWKL